MVLAHSRAQRARRGAQGQRRRLRQSRRRLVHRRPRRVPNPNQVGASPNRARTPKGKARIHRRHVIDSQTARLRQIQPHSFDMSVYVLRRAALAHPVPFSSAPVDEGLRPPNAGVMFLRLKFCNPLRFEMVNDETNLPSARRSRLKVERLKAPQQMVRYVQVPTEVNARSRSASICAISSGVTRTKSTSERFFGRCARRSALSRSRRGFGSCFSLRTTDILKGWRLLRHQNATLATGGFGTSSTGAQENGTG